MWRLVVVVGGGYGGGGGGGVLFPRSRAKWGTSPRGLGGGVALKPSFGGIEKKKGWSLDSPMQGLIGSFLLNGVITVISIIILIK